MQNIESIIKYVFIQDFPIGKDSSRYLLQTYICKVTFEWLPYVTATLPEVTSAISHSDRGSDSRRKEMYHFGGPSRSHFGDTSRSDFGDTSKSNAEVTSRSAAEVAHFYPKWVTSAIRMRYRGRSFLSSRSSLIVPSAIENACRVGSYQSRKVIWIVVWLKKSKLYTLRITFSSTSVHEIKVKVFLTYLFRTPYSRSHLLESSNLDIFLLIINKLGRSKIKKTFSMNIFEELSKFIYSDSCKMCRSE